MTEHQSSAGKATEALGTQALGTQELRPINDDAPESPYKNQNSGLLPPNSDEVSRLLAEGEERT